MLIKSSLLYFMLFRFLGQFVSGLGHGPGLVKIFKPKKSMARTGNSGTNGLSVIDAAPVDEYEYCESICAEWEGKSNDKNSICSIRVHHCSKDTFYEGDTTGPEGLKITLKTMFLAPNPCIGVDKREKIEGATCRNVCNENETQDKFTSYDVCKLPEVCCFRREYIVTEPCRDPETGHKIYESTNCREFCNPTETQLEFAPREVCEPGLICCTRLALL